MAFNPLLASLVGLAALLELYMQLKIGRQRFGLASELSPDERRTFFYGHLLSGVEAAKEIRLFGLADYLTLCVIVSGWMRFPARSNPQTCEETASSGKERPPRSDIPFLEKAIYTVHD